MQLFLQLWTTCDLLYLVYLGIRRCLMKEKDFKELLNKYLNRSSGQSSSGSLFDFEQYFFNKNSNDVFKSEGHKKNLKKSILGRVKNEIHPRSFSWLNTAATILVVFAVG